MNSEVQGNHQVGSERDNLPERESNEGGWLIKKKIQEYLLLQSTISADTQSNKQFCIFHFKVTVFLVIFICFLKLIPSPIMVITTANNPTNIEISPCEEDDVECDQNGEGLEKITIRKINPLNRELKIFINLNSKMLASFPEFPDQIDLNQEITGVEVYAMRNNQIYGLPIISNDGEDLYELPVQNGFFSFAGEVHILNQASYIIKIYKKIWSFEVAINKSSSTPTRRLQQSNEASTPPTSDSAQPIVPSVPQPTTQTKLLSVPIIIENMLYSQFYTVAELLIRYITLLFIFYVMAETQNSPKLFHIIMIITANPLIFTEIAFPNIFSNVISQICSNFYIFYIAIYLYYIHKIHEKPLINNLYLIGKALIVLSLYTVTIISMQHVVNNLYLIIIQWTLIIIVLIPMFTYIKNLYLSDYDTVLHRNILFVILAAYYFGLLFFSDYLISYGWKEIVYYLIIQIYGVSMSYLTNASSIHQEKHTNHKKQSDESLTHSIELHDKHLDIQIQVIQPQMETKCLYYQAI